MSPTTGNASIVSPRNENAVDYALSITRNYLSQFKQREIRVEQASILEIGPGAEFASALAMVSQGAAVTLADRFLAPWDDSFHPGFYLEFLERWDGPKSAIETVVAQGGYDTVLRLLKEPAEEFGGGALRLPGGAMATDDQVKPHRAASGQSGAAAVLQRTCR